MASDKPFSAARSARGAASLRCRALQLNRCNEAAAPIRNVAVVQATQVSDASATLL